LLYGGKKGIHVHMENDWEGCHAMNSSRCLMNRLL